MFHRDLAEQGTDPSLPCEDWNLNMEICDMINDTDEGCGHFWAAMDQRRPPSKMSYFIDGLFCELIRFETLMHKKNFLSLMQSEGCGARDQAALPAERRQEPHRDHVHLDGQCDGFASVRCQPAQTAANHRSAFSTLTQTNRPPTLRRSRSWRPA